MPRFPLGPDGKEQLPKLSATQLRALYESNPCPEVRALLWEIHRLRRLVLRANQLQKAIGGGCLTSTELILARLRKEIRDEPCVLEREHWEADFFGQSNRYTRRLGRED